MDNDVDVAYESVDAKNLKMYLFLPNFYFESQ